MSKVYAYQSSDYAGIDFEGGSFYYGYEQTDDEDNWCFVANTENGEFWLSSKDMPQHNQFDVTRCLMYGIGAYMESNKQER